MRTLFAIELVFVLILFARSGESLKCYVCRSDVDEGCNGDMKASLSQECPPKEGEKKSVLCRKIHQKLKFKGEDSYTSIRECGYEKGHKGCYLFNWVKLANQETCECSEDNCNRGSRHSASILTVTAAVSIWMLNYLKTDHT